MVVKSKKFIDATELKTAAQGRWLEIFMQVAPDLELACKKPGRHVPDPVVGGKDGFRLFADAPQTGAAYSNKDGALKDGIATIQYVTGMSFIETLKEVAAAIGFKGSDTQQPIKRRPVQPNRKPKPSFELSPQEALMRKNKLNSLWKQSFKMDQKQASRARRYLHSRGITRDFSDVAAFRFHPAVWYKNEVGNLCKAPAFLQMWRAADGTPVGMHKILLSTKTAGKAELQNPKLMMKPSGKMSGGAVRIGEPCYGTLSVATGIETALSVTQAKKVPCWSTLNDAMLRAFVPPEDVNHLTIWADNDKPDAQGRNSGVASAYALAKRLRTERPDMKVNVKIPPQEGQDWNDLLNQGNLEAFN